MSFLKQVAGSIGVSGLIPRGARLVLAVSGGRDSMVLLDGFHRLAPESGWQLAVAHFDHRLRAESGTDAELVGRAALAAGLPFFLGAPCTSPPTGMNVELWARQERYRFLAQAAREFGTDLVVTAHHAGDQVETVLLHLLRGSDLAGLAGMSARRALTLTLPSPVEGEGVKMPSPPLTRGDQGGIAPDSGGETNRSPLAPLAKGGRDVPSPVEAEGKSEQADSDVELTITVLRPLLEFEPEVLAEYAEEQHLEYCQDHTNWDMNRRRNSIRHQLLPLLEKEYNPAIRRLLAEQAKRSGELAEWLGGVAQAQLHACELPPERVPHLALRRLLGVPLPLVLLNRAAWNAVPPPVRREAAVQLLESLRPPLENLSRRQVEAVLDLAESAEERGVVHLSWAWEWAAEREMLELRRRLPEAEPFEVALTIPGRAVIPTLGIAASISEIQEQTTPRSDAGGVGGNWAEPPLAMEFDLTGEGEGITIRNWRGGDRILLPQGEGSKKLKRVFQEAALPLDMRKRVPLVVCGGELIWVVGLRRGSRKARPANGPPKRLRIEFQRIAAEGKEPEKPIHGVITF